MIIHPKLKNENFVFRNTGREYTTVNIKMREYPFTMLPLTMHPNEVTWFKRNMMRDAKRLCLYILKSRKERK